VNLVEVMLAGVLFSLASAGSLQVMAGIGRSLQGGAQAGAAAAQLEAELRRSQALVVAGAQQQQATDLACDQPELLLSRLLTDPAPGEGNAPAPSAATPAPLDRQVSVMAPGLVRLQLTAAAGRWQRQRLFSAAAYGLCPSATRPLG
jgi:type II secretory pathway component PulJ